MGAIEEDKARDFSVYYVLQWKSVNCSVSQEATDCNGGAGVEEIKRRIIRG